MNIDVELWADGSKWGSFDENLCKVSCKTFFKWFISRGEHLNVSTEASFFFLIRDFFINIFSDNVLIFCGKVCYICSDPTLLKISDMYCINCMKPQKYASICLFCNGKFKGRQAWARVSSSTVSSEIQPLASGSSFIFLSTRKLIMFQSHNYFPDMKKRKNKMPVLGQLICNCCYPEPWQVTTGRVTEPHPNGFDVETLSDAASVPQPAASSILTVVLSFPKSNSVGGWYRFGLTL